MKETGVGSKTAFSRVFRDTLGTTPSETRELAGRRLLSGERYNLVNGVHWALSRRHPHR